MKDLENDEDVRILVHAFYDKGQKDERLGYIFNEFADVNWNHHLPRMIDWSNLLFQSKNIRQTLSSTPAASDSKRRFWPLAFVI